MSTVHSSPMAKSSVPQRRDRPTTNGMSRGSNLKTNRQQPAMQYPKTQSQQPQRNSPRQKFHSQVRPLKQGRSTNRRPRINAAGRTNRYRSRANMSMDTIPEENPKRKKKKYRKKKVLRAWVLPAVFLSCLCIIWLEHYIGKLIGLEDFREVYQDQLIDPLDRLAQDLDVLRAQETSIIGNPISTRVVANISFTPRDGNCPKGQRRMINIHNPMSHSVRGRLIPKIVHQQAKTRCLTMRVDRATIKWAFRRWSYYIHDEESRSRLFERHCGSSSRKCEFPLLKQIISDCFEKNRERPRYRSLSIELWKFLILWVFGGVYVELGFNPVTFTPLTIQDEDDGFLMIDPHTGKLTTKIMAVSPKHPIMYYAVQILLLMILLGESSSSSPSSSFLAGTTIDNAGSHALSRAFRMFQEGREEEIGRDTYFFPGVFEGVFNRTVRVVVGNGINTFNTTDGSSKPNNDDYVVSIFRSDDEKEREFRKMGMMDVAEANKDEEDSAELLPCLVELHRTPDISLI